MQSRPSRFFSLDALRGLAALVIVFYHWQHFLGPNPSEIALLRQPLYFVLSLFYNKGYMAVDLFFILSGFVFCWLYSEPIAKRKTSVIEFAALRFSRLYPLHIMTLALVAIFQAAYSHHFGRYFVYSSNDIYHFFLNVVFASAWGFQSGFSFNGPSWSVSIEVALYGIFFLMCRFFPSRVLTFVLLSLAGYFFAMTFQSLVGRGIYCFFIGGIVFLLYRQLISSRYFRTSVVISLCAATGGWLLTVLQYYNFLSLPQFVMHRVEKNPFFWPVVVLFPVTILALVLLETERGTLGRRFAFLGDISYSSYLLHFPLQFLFIAACSGLSVSKEVYFSPVTLAVFLMLLVLVSLISFHCFEMPLQRYIRRLLLPMHPSFNRGPAELGPEIEADISVCGCEGEKA